PETYHPLSDQVWKNLQEVLSPVFERQEQFGQALSLPEDQRFVQAAQVAGFYDFFAARGLSEDQARTCLADFPAMEAIAERSDTQSQQLDVTGTPTFFINGRKIDGNSWAQVEQALQQAGAR
ncbi:MAG: thioredoxin domain-containing protein, partial [Pseudomonadota bacterium]|nr:thioredoxin domain-containing protein [Pseudomonadota bacterium]